MMKCPSCVAACLLALAVLLPTVSGQEAAAMITTSPHVAAARVGSEATFQCTSGVNNDTLTVTLEWLYGNGSAVSMNESARVFYTNSTLTVKEAVLEDYGVYTCRDNLGHAANVTLKVYDPDSYFFEGMIIVAINCCLICIFLIGLAYTCYSDRRRGSRDKKGAHKPIAKKSKLESI